MPEPAVYEDRWISCTDSDLRIRGYYFPWGTKVIPYHRIRAVRRVDLSALRGQWRIWGTSNPRFWASLDPKRPSKHVGLVLHVGRRVRPFITPDDPDAVARILRHHGAADDPDSGGPSVLM